MPKADELKVNAQAVQAHLTILQSIIQRMASNSSSCKAWCVALVSAILVVVADKSRPEFALIALLPSILFVALDAYYLALEKGFREAYNDFIRKLHDGSLEASDLYIMSPKGNRLAKFADALVSLSIWPFYAVLIAMTWFAAQRVTG